MKVENMTYNAKTAFTERREIIDKLNECINSINTYGPEKIKDLETKNVQQDSDIANLNTKITNIESKNVQQDSRLTNIETKNVKQDGDIKTCKDSISVLYSVNATHDVDITNLKNADTNNVKINKINEYAVGLTGNQDIGGIKEFVEPIRGRVADVLYAEYSGLLPSGKYRQFAKIPATNSDTMIVLDVMCSANGANYGYGRVIIGNPITTSWFCQWVDRESFVNNEWLTADVIQIGRDITTGDLMIFAKNPTFTALVVNLVYSKYDSDIQSQAKVVKVTNTTDYTLDGTDAGIENIIPGSDTNNVKINKINEYAVGLTGNQYISGIKEFVEPIRGRVADVLYAEYSGVLPSGKYRQFAKIPATNSDTMIVLDVMCSANGANYGYGRVIIGNPITTSWFCQWVDRESFVNNEWLTADVIQIGRDTATGDLMIFAKNPTFTALVVNLVYSKYDSDIQSQAKVVKVANTTDYTLDGTDAGIENIIPGSDTNNVKINKINKYAVGLTGNQNISGVKNFTAINTPSVKMTNNFRPIMVYGNYDPENVTEEIRIRPLTVCPNDTKLDQPIFRIEIFDSADNCGCIISCNPYNNNNIKEIKLTVRKSDGVSFVTAPSRGSTNIADYQNNEIVTIDTLKKLGVIQ